MNYLLDTHVWIWAVKEPEKLGQRTMSILRNADNRLLVSTVSTLEIAQLVSKGRLSLKRAVKGWVKKSLDLLLADTVVVSHDIAMHAYALKPGFHNDPADRLLVSTALCNKCRLITADRKILGYPHVKTLDARK